MKKILEYITILILLIIIFLLSSCHAKKEFVEKRTDSIRTVQQMDCTVVRTTMIQPDNVIFDNNINLNHLDLFKQLYNEKNPHITVDEETGSTISSYVDSDNNLKQKIKAKPKPILKTDTNKYQKTDIKTDVNSESKEKIVIDKTQPKGIFGFISNIWNTIKNTIFVIVIIFVILFVIRKFNVFNYFLNKLKK